MIHSEETVQSVVVERALRLDGHSVTATGKFEEALALLRKDRPDRVLTNVS